jgi:hypothetical protein
MDRSLAEKIAARRAEIDPGVYEAWLFLHGYKRVPQFWERMWGNY